MDVRLTNEQQQLRDAAARLADELGPGSVQDLDDAARRARLEKTVDSTGWRSLRSDGASGVEVAIIAEEFGRGLVDVPFLGPVLADDLRRHLSEDQQTWAIAIGDDAFDAHGLKQALVVRGTTVLSAEIGEAAPGADLTRGFATLTEPYTPIGDLDAEPIERGYALALVATCADLVGTSRGAQTVAIEYAKIREQYGKAIGSYQAVAHLLAESQALIEGSISVLRHAAWAVDELAPADAVRAARIAKIYCARAARTVCETAVQVHGGIGNTWECIEHVYLRRALTSTELFPVSLEEIDLGLS
ncbi:acyl-CoA dehydrogenase family protein [Rhodococcus sp. (in: high G+C Gram-positive bacteria)]|uniref:acyl-CoA dehydrogenase family protein n=1 Tax=unclassified Rhodococcus (in: high G+C Gram-positive bacteria) TaxID=192944 RepID=UPI0019F222EC|nr:acyl-CoA dehydrogenase family protein [Rhodococcus sp. (in: high G+C Gram-positive bacteria)]MBF0662344.1 acyl-CoA dehydrogenase [Rhodococcus sp. (in: high G+C Gram-positive bacteria)]